MKKLILTLAVAAVATASAFGQVVGAGYIQSKANSNGNVQEPMNGFYAGAEASVAQLGPIAVTPGIYFSYMSKTSSGSALGGLVSGTGTTKEMYLDVPVNFSYAIDLGSAKLFAYAGPTFSLGCLSQFDSSASVAGIGGSNSTDLYENGNYGRFDVLVGGGAGIEISQIRLTVGYNYGLLDRNASDNVTLKRSYLHAGIAWVL